VSEPEAHVVYEFGTFRLDPKQRLLASRDDGSPIPLAHKVFETLLYFVERRGEPLDKATLMKAIWPNVVVEENSDTAFRALGRFKRSNTAVAWAAIWLPEMRPFHRDPHFQVFAEHLGLMEYWKQFGPPDHFELREGKLVCL
jgi:hypothetical protein